MKRLTLVLLIAFVSLGTYAQTFDVSRLRAGAGFVYASDINNIGITFNGVYNFNNAWEGALSITHIFPKDELKYTILDFDAHYIFYKANEELNFYGIGGLALTFWKWDGGNRINSASTNHSDVGLNVGAGMNYKLTDFLNLAPEVRLTISDGSYARIGATVQYMF